jgi:hypothetical protein
MEAKNKRWIFLIGSILVALIFLSSYAAFSNNNSGTTSTSTIKPATTYFATGSSRAQISNYSDIAVVTLADTSNAATNSTVNAISDLESNGSVQDYTYTNGSYQIVLSSISPYDLQQILYAKTGLNNSMNVSSTATITLPKNVILHYAGQPINLDLQNRNYSVYLSNVRAIGSVINVSISALLARNGSIYNGQLRVSYSAATGNYVTTTTTVKPTTTYTASGSANVIVTNYSKTAFVTLLSNYNTSKNNFTAIISKLKTNGSVSNYTYLNGSYKVSLPTISPYTLQQLLYNKTGSSNAILVGSNATILMPSNVILHYNNVSKTIHLSEQYYPLYLRNVKPIGSTLNLSIAALVTANGSVYNNQFKVNYSG